MEFGVGVWSVGWGECGFPRLDGRRDLAMRKRQCA